MSPFVKELGTIYEQGEWTLTVPTIYRKTYYGFRRVRAFFKL